MTFSSNSSQSTRPTGQMLGKNYSSLINITRNNVVILLSSAEPFMKGCCQLQGKVRARITG